MQVQVARLLHEAQDVVGLELRAIDGGTPAAPSKPRPGVRRFRVIDGK